MGVALGTACRLQASAVSPARSSFGGRDPQALLDLRHDALVRVEELIRNLRPAAELRDLEQSARRRVAGLVHEARDHGPVAVVGIDPLRLLRMQEVYERLRLVGGLGSAR